MRHEAEMFRDDGMSFRARRVIDLQRSVISNSYRMKKPFPLIKAGFFFILPFAVFFAAAVAALIVVGFWSLAFGAEAKRYSSVSGMVACLTEDSARELDRVMDAHDQKWLDQLIAADCTWIKPDLTYVLVETRSPAAKIRLFDPSGGSTVLWTDVRLIPAD